MEMEPRVAILQDLKIQSFDTIRFASYRTACKLRYVQKSTNLHLVDIWNVIEAFRENGLNTLEHQNEVSVSRLETLVSSLYHNLNKRLPPTQQVPVDSKASLLLNWLLAAYTGDNSGKIRVFSIKVALAIMCAGKMVDKLRYIFSQISDGAGQLIHWKLGDFLREVLALPAAVFESPTFHYKEGLESELFPVENKITVNDFMAALMSEPGPSCLVWLSLLHRLATVETVVHPTICSVCLRENFTGFRYRCQRCHAYQLCQDCFWQGRVSLNHQNDHEVKEYSSYKSPSKQIGHSLRKSFRCVPEKSNQVLPRFPEQPEKTLNLSHIVPPSPLPSHNGFNDGGMIPGMYDRSSTLDSRGTGLSLDSNGTSLPRGGAASNDEEHRLIARYAARLAQESRTPGGSAPDPVQIGLDSSRAQRELIMQLESKNKEIMREIQKLRRQQEAEQVAPESPALMNELRALRQRKGELEGHLGALQDSRRQLMGQLEGLMRMLKNHQTQSPRSTPNSSPRSGKSPPLPQGPQMPNQSRVPMPQNMPPHMQQNMMQQQQQIMLNNHHQEPPGMMGHPHPLDMRGYAPNGNNNGASGLARTPAGVRERNDLHYAVDSVSSAMSSLVRELNSDFDEMQMQMTSHEWSEKVGTSRDVTHSSSALTNKSRIQFKDNAQWQEQFAQWSLNSQNQ
ncbi:dystrobrevin beta isoform X2 [Toxorhynchites rutilus septentrionalis]|uniref:dystrobrevin beta isoform X2 n=1 Tax=Toxorhynchites rutilus septentrionalis TaxID=329112 RepID=UPI002479E225|nr:dystrobrevin beta isoform X2 [Toxorhynchites rutilus septentrionalis]